MSHNVICTYTHFCNISFHICDFLLFQQPCHTFTFFPFGSCHGIFPDKPPESRKICNYLFGFGNSVLQLFLVIKHFRISNLCLVHHTFESIKGVDIVVMQEIQKLKIFMLNTISKMLKKISFTKIIGSNWFPVRLNFYRQILFQICAVTLFFQLLCKIINASHIITHNNLIKLGFQIFFP